MNRSSRTQEGVYNKSVFAASDRYYRLSVWKAHSYSIDTLVLYMTEIQAHCFDDLLIQRSSHIDFKDTDIIDTLKNKFNGYHGKCGPFSLKLSGHALQEG